MSEKKKIHIKEMKNTKKIALLERLVKALTGARRISYHSWHSPVVKLYDVNPSDIKLNGYDEIDVDWGAETAPCDFPLPHRPKLMGIMTAEFWFNENRDERILELEELLQKK